MDEQPRIVHAAGGRTIGYRRLGTGPAVALLHASPRSAAALLPLARRLAERFTVFAFDTPGFGWSDPLPLPRPDAGDYADALMQGFDALGLERAPIYGSHTGAAIAVAAGLRHPARVPALVLDGYAMFTPVEQAESLASYLMPIRPEWDGTHLAMLWSRVKDQFSFYPWYRRAQVSRLPRPLAPLSLLQAVVVDFLAAGDAYRPAYASAFRFPGDAALRALAVPACVMCRSDDLLFGHLDALRDLPGHIRRQPLGTDDAAWAEAVAAGLAGAVAAPPLAGPQTPQEVVRVEGGTLGVTRFSGGTGRPLVLLPGIPGSVAGCEALARALAAQRPVLGIDLPGFGASHLPGRDAAGIARAMADVAGEADVVAIGESAAIGGLLAAGRRLVVLDPVPDAARAGLLANMADLTPRTDGAHLLAAWHQLRDAALWRPWHDRAPAQALDFGTDPDVPRLHAVLRDWMRGGTAGADTLRAGLALPRPAATAMLGAPGHPWAEGCIPVPDEPRARAAAILRALP